MYLCKLRLRYFSFQSVGESPPMLEPSSCCLIAYLGSFLYALPFGLAILLKDNLLTTNVACYVVIYRAMQSPSESLSFPPKSNLEPSCSYTPLPPQPPEIQHGSALGPWMFNVNPVVCYEAFDPGLWASLGRVFLRFLSILSFLLSSELFPIRWVLSNAAIHSWQKFRLLSVWGGMRCCREHVCPIFLWMSFYSPWIDFECL